MCLNKLNIFVVCVAPEVRVTFLLGVFYQSCSTECVNSVEGGSQKLFKSVSLGRNMSPFIVLPDVSSIYYLYLISRFFVGGFTDRRCCSDSKAH